MLTRAQKEERVADLKGMLARATCVYVADYRGVDVESVNQLRRRIRTEGGGDFEYRVAKNSLLRRAAEAGKVAGVTQYIDGPTAVAFSFGDPVGLAKILVDFSKDHEVFELRGGLLEGELVDSDAIGTLATLPSLEALHGQIVGLLQAPATKLLRIISEPGGQLARVAAARGSQQEE